MGAVASIAASCAWPPFALPTVFLLLGFFLTRAMLLTIVAWQFACLLMLYIHSDALIRRPSDSKRLVACSIAWELFLVPVLVCAYLSNLHYKISQLGWAIIGPPRDLYGFANAALPRLIAWLICTVPLAVLALWFYGQAKAPRTD